MKLAIIALLLTATCAHAGSMDETCQDLAGVSAAAADLRDSGVPLARALKALDDAVGPKKDVSTDAKKLLRAITVQAYASSLSAAELYIIVEKSCLSTLGGGA